MHSDIARIDIVPDQFVVAERVLARWAGLTASTFRYRSGVAALRIENAVGHIIQLPFQGQQIWDAVFLAGLGTQWLDHSRAQGALNNPDSPTGRND
jgi:hypothetical protein